MMAFMLITIVSIVQMVRIIGRMSGMIVFLDRMLILMVYSYPVLKTT